MLDSAILELFEFIKVEDIKSLCLHVIEQFGKMLEDVEYVTTFKTLMKKYEQHQEKSKDRDRGMNIQLLKRFVRVCNNLLIIRRFNNWRGGRSGSEYT